jgi:hemerythrin-like domain-containing protein
MQTTQILMNEHRTIEQVLLAIEGMAVKAVRERQLDPQHAGQAIAFIRRFADKFHHSKEEDLLFVEMETAGFPRHGGPIAVMLHEHDAGRALVGQMADVVEQAAAGDAAALATFSDRANQFASLLRAHIQKEDGILYPMADELLGEASQTKLLADFARAEEAHGGKAARKEFEATATRLAGFYAALAPKLGPSQAGKFGCGSIC